MIKHRNGVRTKALSEKEQAYLINNSTAMSCVRLARSVGISRHMVQKFIEEQGLRIKIKKPRRNESDRVSEGYFNPHEREWI